MTLSEMTTGERLQAFLHFQPMDRLPLAEWAMWWDKTINRWHGEGLPHQMTDRYAITEFFGLDVHKQLWIDPIRKDAPKPAHHGAGIITDEAGYERILPYLYPDIEDRLPDLRQWGQERREGTIGTWFTIEGFFWFARTLLGIENHLFAFYDQPELLERINQDLCAWIERIIGPLTETCPFDFMTFAEDMSYNHGPMLSHESYLQIMDPYYRRIIPRLHAHQVISIVDSDGNVTDPLAWFLQSGLDGLLPLERQSGVDAVALAATYPDALFIGGYDKTVMHLGPEAIAQEFARMLPAARRGGFMVSVDHQTPPGVSLKDYYEYLHQFRQFAIAACQ